MSQIRAVSYSRVSSPKQVKSEGLTIKGSLDKQKSDAEKICSEQGWQYLGDYREAGRSAELNPEISIDESVEGRPVLGHLLDSARRGEFEVLIIRHSDRLARLQHLYLDLCYTLEVECRIQIYNLSKPYPIVTPESFNPRRDNRRVFERGFEAMQGQMEQNDRLKKLDDGRKHQIKNGRFIASKPPFGYRIEFKPRPNSTTVERVPVPDPVEFPILKEILLMAINGLTTSMIIKHLVEKGYKTRQGNPWRKTVLREIILNPFYAGILRYGYHIASPNKVPGSLVKNKDLESIVYGEHNYIKAITKEEYEKIISFRKNLVPDNLGKHNGKNKNPLLGIIKCGYCYGPLSITVTSKYKTGKHEAYQIRYFRCVNHFDNRHVCRPNYVLVNAVFERLGLIFDARANEEAENPSLYYLRYNQTNYNSYLTDLENTINNYKKKVTQLDTRLVNLLDALGDNIISKEDYTLARDRYAFEKKTFLEKIDKAQEEYQIIEKDREKNEREKDFLTKWRRYSKLIRETPYTDWTDEEFSEIKIMFASRLKAVYLTGKYVLVPGARKGIPRGGLTHGMYSKLGEWKINLDIHFKE